MARGDRRSFNNAGVKAADISALKRKAVTIPTVQIRAGGKVYDLPVEAYVVKGDAEGRYVFLSLPTVNAVLGRRSDGKYEVINGSEQDAAVKLLKAAKAPSTKKIKSSCPTLPPKLEQAIKDLVPGGHRVRLAADGSYRLVKLRPRQRG